LRWFALEVQRSARLVCLTGWQAEAELKLKLFLVTPDVAALLFVSVPLDEVAGSGTGARSNRSALFTANQGSAYRAGHSPDDHTFRLAVVMSVTPPVSLGVSGNRQHNKNE
jgi:hypothetical protein